jgi:cytochrome oxidase Cu insertion factor (SCO1/SenC/PrrC family)
MKSVKLRIVSVFLCCAFLPVFGMGNQEQPVAGLVGNLLQHSSPAPDFTLTDQNNASFHMAAMKGKVVLLSFIYTHCTDICPYVSLKIKEVHDLLGADADKVVLVAVTTDPKRDVPEVTAAYSREIGLLDAWHFLGGTPKAVQDVWFSYGIGVTVDPDTAAVAPPKDEKMSAISSKKDKADDKSGPDSDAPVQGLSESDLALASTIVKQFGGGYDVGHSAPFWIVDKEGLIRVGMDADATPADVVTNIRALVALR